MRQALLIFAFSLGLSAADATAADLPGADCIQGSAATPERAIEDCDALLMEKATAEARAPDILLARAEAFVRQGRLRPAVEDLGHVVTLRPDYTQAFLRRAELHRTLAEADAAIRDFSAAIRLDPTNTNALFARAELYRAKIDRRRALADYATVLRLDPTHEAARAGHKSLALEIERLGATMPTQPSGR
ncbi:hypothetical protein [Bradyrhizobium sp. LHD-71]|uniref:hypothetical protein n=1 Tax=Bradyrhizobium sp. LHD-71 TaxID=3072141 RepID=UPI00280F0661|nr:hypothetical protein [Bradyrhizobium sp. LHD-71]MDQ8726706.1 hypothetical protein [Bradyrhizobium sp. LHD-71]